MPASERIAMNFVASRNLVVVDPARGELRVCISIGLPYQCGQDEWACPVALDGLYEKLRDQHGADSFQSSLMLAQNLARTLLTDFVEKGGTLLDAPGGATITVERLFTSGVMS
jgi:hypothetical protein